MWVFSFFSSQETENANKNYKEEENNSSNSFQDWRGKGTTGYN